ncbi:MAG: hypothetical protein K9L66_09945 [Spirochaetaceae bacterium]|nr:hypothetical protein [Spirochaetaceae bacterium]MCF7948570.1 hypothetical protein [Spirochaetia bacterium]MCF7951817.1 hypothetical protein [Spirochaetaceae bacterium]
MKKGLRVLFIAAAAVVFIGCVGMRGTLSVGLGTSAKSTQVSASQIGPFENNSTVQLEAARYRGDVEIRANKVVLKGQGTRATEIAGDVRITGNSCTITGLTISGNVYLSGNNNNIRGANVTGEVISEGNNNSW